MTTILTLEPPSLPHRPLDAHKGLFGHVLVIGGDFGMPGSVRIAGEGALRVGAGCVTIVTRKLHVSAVVAGRPELMCYGISWPEIKISSLIKKATVIVIGPGLGQSNWSKWLFAKVMRAKCPLVVDADALNLLAQHTISHNWVLTPHPGEAARLLGINTQDILADKVAAINQIQQKYGGTIVLKGVNTLIKSQDSIIKRCIAGNPGMASPGMGDLLSGMIGGLIAQGLTLPQAAQAGVFLHATAGDAAALQRGERGLLASDLLDAIGHYHEVIIGCDNLGDNVVDKVVGNNIRY